ncbi:MAG: D-aminoacyl-tRNA deacylase [Pyrinomonadaceae bacterium]
MRALVQRVSRARVSVGTEVVGEIGNGMLVLLGVSVRDQESDAMGLVDKTLNLRIFDDANGKMNLSLLESGGGLLVVSQFTLYGNTRKGRRPSYIEAARPDEANRLYEFFITEARKHPLKVESGRFQAMMDVELVNDGPVTLLLDTASDS